jgi:hypothetical protein
MEPYEAVLSDWLQKMRPTLRCLPDRATATLELCIREIQQILDRFSSLGIAPREKLWTSDFVWAAGRLKLHSLTKMESVAVGRSWIGLGEVGELFEELGRWLSVAS